MDETYIIIEEDNERKILLEGKDIKEAHREAEKRYRHLVEPPAAGPDLDAIRQAFLHRADPEPEDEIPAAPDIPAENTPPENPPAEPEVPKASEAPENPPAESPRQEEIPIEVQVRELIEKYKSQRPDSFAEPTPDEAAAETAESPEAPSPKAAPEPETESADPGIRYTVINESDVEILEATGTGFSPVFAKPIENRPQSGKNNQKNSGKKTGGWRRHVPSILAAAGVLLLCLLWLYVIWR